MVETKLCTDCKQIKQIMFFSKNRTKKDGLESQCKECRKERKREYNSRPEVQEKIKSYRKKYQDTHKEKLQLKEKKRWASEEHRAYQKRYRINNRERFRKSNRMYSKKNKPALTVKFHVNIAKAKGLFSEWSVEEYKEMMEHFDHKCAITGKKENLEIDHFIPLSTGHGGTHSGNLAPLNASINQSKAFLNPFEWIKGRSDKEKEAFNKLVKYLANLNNLTVFEFKVYVYWCFDNKKT
ncbi:HNH endonuclease [Priestia megaterium]|uniref:HNH nuclease domain-containing protein n=1 Tax=Priestia megaterium (strain ATCC 14581 / DSM 32 / CCUG 1817 / JCM 2506 / NBRC 15308 / NCIMB 9376 / NCTC 10342 / NRRL B-14308 / VKM B-512 / Ford 19) TaxID=1348623 RepID=A0A0B6AJH1_PRIM2|nr:HNH endonuclease signature motif containing protein [Priestia megaterium]AJI20743.1 hypothetical protein BG04_1457 [Priestia megaterium NBRC 15308 = ATCC 14581]KGJ84219.1 hypothetical protein BMT_13150 [Priestia megaterium NBRC 15308 = ATCC 14581]MED3805591.1 HNH endonuclease signature motif containing protein [Priestia megaterium]NMM59846.1 HNH endonuclease [Priestia megaterium]QSF27252.1 HNH endonuclease [Priestia megaterium]